VSENGESPNFYQSYIQFKDYQTPELKTKDIGRFDAEFWTPAQMHPGMSVLEIGCGTGKFLAYLQAKGVADFLGLDADKDVGSFIPPGVQGHFKATTAGEFLDADLDGRRFDRIVLFDVLEHFTTEEGAALLIRLAQILKSDGRIVLRLPNNASPWGAAHQFGDLTHKAAYNPNSIRQLAGHCGLICSQCYGHNSASRRRQWTDKIFHKAVSFMLMSAPEIWTANFYAVLTAAPPPST